MSTKPIPSGAKSPTTPAPAFREWLAYLYRLRDWPAVSAYLQQNPFLAGLLLEAHARIQEHFGAGTQIALEVFADPEEDGEQELFALVLTTLPPRDALSCLDRLDQDWWLEASRTAQCRMNIDVEYV